MKLGYRVMEMLWIVAMGILVQACEPDREKAGLAETELVFGFWEDDAPWTMTLSGNGRGACYDHASRKETIVELPLRDVERVFLEMKQRGLLDPCEGPFVNATGSPTTDLYLRHKEISRHFPKEGEGAFPASVMQLLVEFKKAHFGR